MEDQSQDRPFTAGDQQEEDDSQWEDENADYVADTGGRRMLFWIAGGLVILVIVLVLFLYGQRKEPEQNQQVFGSEERVAKLEARAVELEAALRKQAERLAGVEKSLQNLTLQQDRLLEKTDRIASGALSPSVLPKEPEPATAKPEEKKPVKEAAPEKKEKKAAKQEKKAEPKEKAPAKQEKKATSKESAAKIHKVQAGDTLYSISKKYGVDINELRRLNNIKENNITLGQSLRLPAH